MGLLTSSDETAAFERFPDSRGDTLDAERHGDMEPKAVPAALLLRLARGDENDRVAAHPRAVSRNRLTLLTLLAEVEWAVPTRDREGYSYHPYDDGSVGALALRRDVWREGLPGVEAEGVWADAGGRYSRARVVDEEALAEACADFGIDEDLRLHTDMVVAEYGGLGYPDLLRTADIYVDVDWADPNPS